MMLTNVRVLELRRTCRSHPAQWEGRTADGRFIYVRYRWGQLQVGFGATIEEAVEDEKTFVRNLGGPYDGVLEYADLVAATPGIEWPV